MAVVPAATVITIGFAICISVATSAHESRNKLTVGTPILRGESAIKRLRDDGSYQSLSTAMTAASHAIDTNGGRATAYNPSNDLQMSFTTEGLQIRSKAKGNTWTSNWRLASFGYGELQTPAKGGTLGTEGNRVEIDRGEMNLREWFVNGPAGVEHGFTVAARPTTPNEGEFLRLVLEISGDLSANAEQDGQALTLTDVNGSNALTYDKLKVWDANGQELAARMRTDRDHEVWLEVDDRSAAYPLTIDPLFAQEAMLVASDPSSSSNLGYDVAISGDTVVIGAAGDTVDGQSSRGSAYVFVRSGPTWVFQQKLTGDASEGNVFENFGSSVAIDGDTAVIGAPGERIGTAFEQGAVYVFVRSGATWARQQKLTEPDPDLGVDRMGEGVAIEGDIIVIESVDAIYIYYRTGTTWTLNQPKMTIMGIGNNVGGSVAIDQERIVVGSVSDDINGVTDAGAVHILERTFSTPWAEVQLIFAPDARANDYFGEDVAIDGDTIVVGVESADIGTNVNQGSVYIFVRNGSNWSLQQKLVQTDAGGRDDRFGVDVAITNNTVVIGQTNVVFAGRESVYTFDREGTTWVFKQKFGPTGGQFQDSFGESIAIACDKTVIVGAPGDNLTLNNQGSAYIYISTDPTSGQACLSGCSALATDRKPFDFDADGRADLSVFRPGTGDWFVQRTTQGPIGRNLGVQTDRLAPADFDGDDKTDFAVWRDEPGDPNRANFYYLRSSDQAFVASQFGRTGDDPSVVDDWDGDGKADSAVFRPGQGGGQSYFYYRPSSQVGVDFMTIPWGIDGDRPLRGDFDGDDKADAAVFRASTAIWYILNSATGNVSYARWGIATDKFVPSDYDCDGKTDPAVFRDGTWYILQSRDGEARSENFGASGDTLVPADYDGDGRADIAIFRNGVWYLDQSTAGPAGFGFGLGSDIPVPSAFVGP